MSSEAGGNEVAALPRAPAAPQQCGATAASRGAGRGRGRSKAGKEQFACWLLASSGGHCGRRKGRRTAPGRAHLVIIDTAWLEEPRTRHAPVRPTTLLGRLPPLSVVVVTTDYS